MGKKKGNTIIIMLIFVFLISSFIGSFIILNNTITKKVDKMIAENNEIRKIELCAYEYFLSDWEVNDMFYIVEQIIIYKLDEKIRFYIYEENGTINIRRLNKND